jgi:hypothetical protein
MRRALYTAVLAVPPKPYRFSTYVGKPLRDPGYGCIQARCEAGHGPDRVASNDQRQGGADQGRNQWSGEGTPQQCLPPHEAGFRNQTMTPDKLWGVVSP